MVTSVSQLRALERYRQRYPERFKKSVHKSQQKLKLSVFIRYSGTNPPQCANPFGEHKEPYITLEALSIDRINGGHRKSGIPHGAALYSWLKKHNYPEGWQVLCMNCQWIKKIRNRE